MLKWSFSGIAVGCAAAMLYEWMWTGWESPWLLAALAAGAFLSGMLAWGMRRRTRPPRVRPMEWFTMAVVMAALFYSMLEHTVAGHLTHIPVMPLYLILFLDFFVSGWYTWWKRRRY